MIKQKLIHCILLNGKILILDKDNTISNLRIYHNKIKDFMIKYAVSNIQSSNISLLDIAVGRGGDIMKWTNSGIKYIVGIDNHRDSIKEAINRLVNLRKSKKNLKLPFCKFNNLSAIDSNVLQKLNDIDDNKKYDLVSCQFAFHYFTQNDTTYDIVLNLISQKLKKNGLFIGTATDGDLIEGILKNGNFYSNLFQLEYINNNTYTFNISEYDSLKTENYFKLQGVSNEFFLKKQELINKCKKYSLELIDIKNFSEYYSSEYNLTISEMSISFLNFSFIFKKI